MFGFLAHVKEKAKKLEVASETVETMQQSEKIMHEESNTENSIIVMSEHVG